MRPMVLAFPEEHASHRYVSQYMFSPCLLVGAFTDKIYLPAGKWFDYWTGDEYLGPGEISYIPPDNRGGALFVKAGSIIPIGPDIQYVGQKCPNALTLEIFPGADGKFTLYEDDGVSYDYEEGAFAQTEFLIEETRNSLRIVICPRKGSYAGMPDPPEYLLKVHLREMPGEVVRVEGELQENRLEETSFPHGDIKDDMSMVRDTVPNGAWAYDPVRNLLWVRVGKGEAKPLAIEVRF